MTTTNRCADCGLRHSRRELAMRPFDRYRLAKAREAIAAERAAAERLEAASVAAVRDFMFGDADDEDAVHAAKEAAETARAQVMVTQRLICKTRFGQTRL